MLLGGGWHLLLLSRGFLYGKSSNFTGVYMGSKTSVNGEFPPAMFDCSWLISVFADGSYSNQGILPHIARPPQIMALSVPPVSVPEVA